MSVLLKSPDGSSWWVYVKDDAPSLGVTKHPPPSLITDGVYENPVWFSTPNRLKTLRWRVSNAGALTVHVDEQPLSAARVEYISFLSPSGIEYVYGLTDAGAAFLQPFASGIPTQRRLTTTAMHKGKLLWVADNRQPIPRSGW